MTIGDVYKGPQGLRYRVVRIIGATGYGVEIPTGGRYGNEWRRGAPKEVRIHEAWKKEEAVS